MSKSITAARFTMRRITSGDIPDLLRIAKDCGLSPWSENDYIEEAKRADATMICLESAAPETIGFLVGRRVLNSRRTKGYDAELYNIGVKAGFRKQGCGGMLLNRFLDICRNDVVQSVWLDVRSSNKNAIQFYKNFGFTEYTVRNLFYSDPEEDGIVMRLNM
jgi:ribosomal-protein-alanine N-acetyltransferase